MGNITDEFFPLMTSSEEHNAYQSFIERPSLKVARSQSYQRLPQRRPQPITTGSLNTLEKTQEYVKDSKTLSIPEMTNTIFNADTSIVNMELVTPGFRKLMSSPQNVMDESYTIELQELGTNTNH